MGGRCGAVRRRSRAVVAVPPRLPGRLGPHPRLAQRDGLVLRGRPARASCLASPLMGALAGATSVALAMVLVAGVAGRDGGRGAPASGRRRRARTRCDTPSVRSPPPTSPSPADPSGERTMSSFCGAHRLPRAGVDPIDSARAALAVIDLAMRRPADRRDGGPRPRRGPARAHHRRRRRHRRCPTRSSTSSSGWPSRSPRPAGPAPRRGHRPPGRRARTRRRRPLAGGQRPRRRPRRRARRVVRHRRRSTDGRRQRVRARATCSASRRGGGG